MRTRKEIFRELELLCSVLMHEPWRNKVFGGNGSAIEVATNYAGVLAWTLGAHHEPLTNMLHFVRSRLIELGIQEESCRKICEITRERVN